MNFVTVFLWVVVMVYAVWCNRLLREKRRLNEDLIARTTKMAGLYRKITKLNLELVDAYNRIATANYKCVDAYNQLTKYRVDACHDANLGQQTEGEVS